MPESIPPDLSLFRRWLLTTLAATVALLVLAAGFVVVTDPFLHYHRPWFGYGQVVWKEAYLNPGLAKHLDYNAVVVGGSYVQNTKVSTVDEVLGVRSVKLTSAGGTPANLNRLFGLALGSGRDIKTVIVASPLTKFLSDNPQGLRSDLPEYLWDQNPFNDVAYLLNREVIAYTLREMAQNALGINPRWTEQEWLDQAYSWWPNYRNKNGKAYVLKHYRVPQPGSALPDDQYLSAARSQFDANIRPFVEAHPQTTFHFILPPFSRLYWRDALVSGRLDAQLAVKQWLVDQLLAYPNVRVHDFMAMEVTADLDNYKDRTHFLPPVSEAMTRALSTEEYLVKAPLTADDLRSFRDLVAAYDDPDIPREPDQSSLKPLSEADQDLF